MCMIAIKRIKLTQDITVATIRYVNKKNGTKHPVTNIKVSLDKELKYKDPVEIVKGDNVRYGRFHFSFNTDILKRETKLWHRYPKYTLRVVYYKIPKGKYVWIGIINNCSELLNANLGIMSHYAIEIKPRNERKHFVYPIIESRGYIIRRLAGKKKDVHDLF